MSDAIKLKVYEEAVDLLQQEGYEASTRDDYSGRAMYGKTCPAIVSDAPVPKVGAAVAQAMVDLEECHDTPIMSLIPGRSDGMGRDQVVYY